MAGKKYNTNNIINENAKKELRELNLSKCLNEIEEAKRFINNLSSEGSLQHIFYCYAYLYNACKFRNEDVIEVYKWYKTNYQKLCDRIKALIEKDKRYIYFIFNGIELAIKTIRDDIEKNSSKEFKIFSYDNDILEDLKMMCSLTIKNEYFYFIGPKTIYGATKEDAYLKYKRYVEIMLEQGYYMNIRECYSV